MIANLSRRVNFGTLAIAAAWTTLSFGALTAPTPAAAQGAGGYYTAQLEAPAKRATSVAGGVVWSCDGTECKGTKGTSRPVRICRELNRELGTVTGFATKGEALGSEDLARCND